MPASLYGGESSLDSQLLDAEAADALRSGRWMGWRLRLLVLAALAGCLGVFLLAHWLAESPHLNATWRTGAQGQIELTRTDELPLRPYQGQALIGLGAGQHSVSFHGPLVLQRSARWLVDDGERARHAALHEELAAVMTEPVIALTFSGGESIDVATHPRGYVSLGAMFWLLCAMGLMLYLTSMVVLLAKPNGRNLLYALMALCQAGNLVFIAIESAHDLGLPSGFSPLDVQARMTFDLLSAAAIVHAFSLHPTRLPGGSFVVSIVWVATLLLLGFSFADNLPHGWWWTQASMIVSGLVALGLLTWSRRIEPHPFASMLRRFIFVAVGTMALLTAAIAAADHQPGIQQTVAGIGSIIWYVFFASLLMLVPFLSRSQQLVREFSLLAAVSTVATALDLVFIAVFSLGQFTSLTLSLFLSLSVYAGARQWLVNQVLGNNMLSMERMFEHLYRIAREVEARPAATVQQLSRLMRELFEPLEIVTLEKRGTRTRVVANGSTLLVPVPELGDPDAEAQPLSLVIRYAHRGRRLFTIEDARLSDRVVEQLRRAVAFDKAVEQGRSEERTRLAQDLHDDIGARLLTLMYKAQTPEIEDYVRHTLQDLKTLTRGLAAANHRLSHAAAEWKTDLAQRFGVAHIQLEWSLSADEDPMLSVVQWSALTRVLRELATNVIAHAGATLVSIDFSLEDDRVDLRITDNGHGRNPRAWAHGLGLGGVRKRVKQLGGQVEWLEHVPQGIVCRVRVPHLSRH